MAFLITKVTKRIGCRCQGVKGRMLAAFHRQKCVSKVATFCSNPLTESIQLYLSPLLSIEQYLTLLLRLHDCILVFEEVIRLYCGLLLRVSDCFLALYRQYLTTSWRTHYFVFAQLLRAYYCILANDLLLEHATIV